MTAPLDPSDWMVHPNGFTPEPTAWLFKVSGRYTNSEIKVEWSTSGGDLDAAETDTRAYRVLRAVYDRGGPGDLIGLTVVRGLLHAGCAACQASRDQASRALAFLLHERVNDPEAVVQLIEANGFCPEHAHQARDLAVQRYGDDLKIVILYEHLLRSLARRLDEDPQLLRVLVARRGCPICAAAREAGRAAVEWLQEALATPEAAALYAASDGLCLGHLAVADRGDTRLTAPAWSALQPVGDLPDGEYWLAGVVPARVAVLWCGVRAHGEAGMGAAATDCPVCHAVAAAERHLLESMAGGAVPADPPCPLHLCQLYSFLPDGRWPAGLITLIVERAGAALLKLGEQPVGFQRLRTALARALAREVRSREGDGFRGACPVCTAGDQATADALVGLSPARLAESGCLDHIALLGSMYPSEHAILRDRLRLRVIDLLHQIEIIYRAGQRPTEQYRRALAQLADQLIGLRAQGAPEGNRIAAAVRGSAAISRKP